MNIYLETERFILRRFTGDDVNLLVELDSDPEVMRYITDGSAAPRSVTAFELDTSDQPSTTIHDR